MILLAALVGGLLLLQGAESLWRRLGPDPPPGAAASSAESSKAEPSPPEIRREEDLVVVEYAGERIRVGLDDEEEASELVQCIQDGLERAFGGLDASGQLREGESGTSRRQTERRVREITRGCVDRMIGLPLGDQAMSTQARLSPRAPLARRR